MYRTHTCGALRIEDQGNQVVLSGWVQSTRDLGGLTFVDLRDRYGITQLVFDMDADDNLGSRARKLGREFVIRAEGLVRERSSKNPNRPTGDIEVAVQDFTILNASKVPPFTIEEVSDGGDELRMRYRYLDIRRSPIRDKIIFRSEVALETRKYLSGEGFIEIETPCLIKSTPEGARDFIVPSRMNPGQFYALPQSPQTFKQILMVAGMDKYFQVVKCFRDEDLRADRQPEFTQIDCEMAFVTRDDVLATFEGLTRHVFRSCIGVELSDFPRMSYDEAIARYGSDKPDLRFGLPVCDISNLARGKGFKVFDDSPFVGGLCAKGIAGTFSRKEIDALTEWVKRPQIGAKGLIWVRLGDEGPKSSVDKFFTSDDLHAWAVAMDAGAGDMLFILSGDAETARRQLGDLRIELGNRLGLRDPGKFAPLWVIDFPLLEWDDERQRFHAMHHPFTSPKAQDSDRMLSDDHNTLKSLRADAYDLVINGAEIGGGSIRIHDRALQERNFKLLGFTPEQAEAQFGFLLGAFEYGAPPHGGIAFGFDRLCAVMQGETSIRDFIAFPKNNQGRDTMIDAPAPVDEEQLRELNLRLENRGA